MKPLDDSVPNIFRRGDLQLRQTTLPILSLNEAWLRTLDRCVLNRRLIPLSQVDQYLGLAGRIRNGTGFDFFGRS